MSYTYNSIVVYAYYSYYSPYRGLILLSVNNLLKHRDASRGSLSSLEGVKQSQGWITTRRKDSST